MVQYVLIPLDADRPLQHLSYDITTTNSEEGDVDDISTSCSSGDQLPQHLIKMSSKSAEAESDTDIFEFEIVPLRRMSDETPGVYAYYRRVFDEGSKASKKPNVRATCLVFACGQYSKRMYSDVYIGRYGKNIKSGKVHNMDISIDEIHWGCRTSDLRLEILRQLDSHGEKSDITIPDWIADASKEHYIDSIQISALAKAFEAKESDQDSDSSSEEESDDEDSDNEDAKHEQIRNTTLCLYCRGPSQHLCKDCQGAYFCEEPRPCIVNGWSHQCLCRTWKIYTEHRSVLSAFPFVWAQQLTQKEYQLSDDPYREYLTKVLNVLGSEKVSWWNTEVDGWAAGLSGSAQGVDASIRRSYLQGFLLDEDLIPPERHITDEDCLSAGIDRDARGLPILNSWEDYYAIRGMPLTSPVALLCTFPLTIYYAIQHFGEVPITVAKMLGRKLRIHAVGIEKEMNFIDLFKELAFLLPLNVSVELTFVVRADMLPPKCRKEGSSDSLSSSSNGYDMKVELASNLTLMVKSGTYGDELNPLFGDVGSGSADMIVGINAGLFAYKSWSSVVSFCHDNPNVVAVFSDYNEHSGMNCASLGGGKARESLCINPFRQPLAMPVYCMNLPQFSNGFLYVFNEQELDE